MMRTDHLALIFALLLTGITVINGLVANVSARTSSPHAFGTAATLSSLIPAGARVCVDGGRGLEGPSAGAAAYFLHHADLYGELRTGYSTFFRLPPSGSAAGLCAWFLLPADAPPPPVIALPSAAWEGNGWRLYQRDPAVIAALDVRELVEPPRADRSAAPGVSAAQPISAWRDDGSPDGASWTPPLLGVLAPTWGARWRAPLLAGSVTFSVQGDTLSVRYRDSERADASLAQEGTRSLEVVFAVTGAPANVSIGTQPYGDGLVLAPGVSVISVGGVGDVARVEFLERTGTVRAITAYLVARDASGVSVQPAPDVFPLSAEGSADSGDALLKLEGPLGEAEAVLDIYREDGSAHYGYWQLGSGQLSGSLTLELAAQRLSTPSAAGITHETFPVTDGRYRAYLARYRNGKPERMLPLFSFQLQDGRARDFVMETRGDRVW